MSLLSLFCLLVVSSSALANNYRTQQRDVPLPTSNYGAPQPLLDIKPVSGYGAPLLDKPTGYGAPLQDKPTSGYGAPLLDKPTGYGAPLQDKPMIQFDAPASGYGYQKKLRFRDNPRTSYGYGKQQLDAPVSSYGRSSYGSGYGNGEQQFDLPQAPITPPSQWDILCQNQAPLTIIVLSDQASWVVCVDSGKGQLQSCQPGLIFIKETNKCERRTQGEHPCNQGVCKNNAQCIPTGQSEFQCQCAPGFDGETCELDARVCQTQNPCGQERCQSFPSGAALSYVCIIGGNQAYGPSQSQATPNPCAQSPNGPQALSYTTHGFLLCDGERMHIRACPGATVWDSNMQTCTFDQRTVQRDMPSNYGGYGSTKPVQRDMPPTNYGGYGSAKPVQRDMPSNYGSAQPVQRDPVNSYYASSAPLSDASVISSSSYGSASTIFRDPVQVSSYGRSQLDTPVASSYGSKTVVPQQQDQTQTSYGATILRDPTPGSSYGSSVVLPQRDAPMSSSYGSSVQRDPTPVSNYGSSVILPQRDFPTQTGYGAPKQRDEVKSGY